MISPAAAAVVTPQNVNPFQHLVDCFHVLINDSVAHEQYCSPGILPPGQLAPTFSSPTAACPTYGARETLQGDVKLASLGDYEPYQRLADELKVAVESGCYTPPDCWSSIDKLGFETYAVASLRPEFVQPIVGERKLLVAQSYCDE